MSLYDLRINYDQDTLLEDKIPQDPMALFDAWFKQSEAKEPNAMCLSTVSNNKPSSRIVLCKSYSCDGFTFFTNHDSRKGLEISANPWASIVFYWEQRSVRIEGQLSKISEKSSQDYFSSRPRASQIGAWTSPQSQILSSRKELDDLYLKTLEKFQNVKDIPKPDFWGGYILKPESIEFWQGRPSRLHDRIKYIKVDLGPKRRFLTEKSQIPTRVVPVTPHKIYFTPSKLPDQIFISTPYSKQQPGLTKRYSPRETLQSPGAFEKVSNLAPPLVNSQNVLEKQETIKEKVYEKQVPVSREEFSRQVQREVQREVQLEVQRQTASSNKRAFYEEEFKTVKKSKKDKFKTPKTRKIETLKRKSTFTVLDQEVLDLLPEKGWITPASRRLGRMAARRPIVKEKSSVMCQTLPVQQESKRIKVTPSIDRFKPKIPDSISKPVLQGNELDEKTVQVLLNAAKENININSLESGFKVPLPFAKENISPNLPTDNVTQSADTVAAGITSVPAPELPKFSFSSAPPPAKTTSSPGTTDPVSSSVSPPKPAFSFSLPGSTTPILSTVPTTDTTASVPKFSFNLPSSNTTAIGTTAAPSSSFPSFGIPGSAAPAPTGTTTSAPVALSLTVVATSTPTPKAAGAAAPSFNFGAPSATSSTLSATSVPAAAPISFSFGSKSSESTPSLSAAPSLSGTKENAASAMPTFGFVGPASTVTSAGPSVTSTTAPPASSAFGQPAAASASTSTFGFGSSFTPSTVAPQPIAVSQASTAPTFGFGSSAISSTVAPNISGGIQASAVPSFGFGSSASPATTGAGATPTFGFSQASTKPSPTPAFGVASGSTASSAFGQTAATTVSFGQSNPSTGAPFLQPAPSTSSPFVQPALATSPFGQTPATPFGQASTSVTSSHFGQNAPFSTAPFGTSTNSTAPFGQTSATTTNAPFGQSSAPFGTAPPSSAFVQTPSTSASSGFTQPGSTPASFGHKPALTGFSATVPSFGQGAGFGQPSSGFPSSTFGQASASSTFNPATPSAPLGSAPTPFGNAGPGTTSASSFGFSNAPVQFGVQAPNNAPVQYGVQAPNNAPAQLGGSTFTFGQAQGSAPTFSFGAQSPVGAPASSGFSFNTTGGPQMPQMPSGPGFSLGAGGDTTRKLAQPKGRLRKAGLRR